MYNSWRQVPKKWKNLVLQGSAQKWNNIVSCLFMKASKENIWWRHFHCHGWNYHFFSVFSNGFQYSPSSFIKRTIKSRWKMSDTLFHWALIVLVSKIMSLICKTATASRTSNSTRGNRKLYFGTNYHTLLHGKKHSLLFSLQAQLH